MIGRAALALAIFAGGYVCGLLHEQRAEAQVGSMATDALKNAAVGAGLGTVGELGTAIVDMEQHVSGLQKNLDTLKKVKAVLGG